MTLLVSSDTTKVKQSVRRTNERLLVYAKASHSFSNTISRPNDEICSIVLRMIVRIYVEECNEPALMTMVREEDGEGEKRTHDYLCACHLVRLLPEAIEIVFAPMFSVNAS